MLCYSYVESKEVSSQKFEKTQRDDMQLQGVCTIGILAFLQLIK